MPAESKTALRTITMAFMWPHSDEPAVAPCTKLQWRSLQPRPRSVLRANRKHRPIEIAECRRCFVVISAPVQPGNDGPNTEQKRNQQQTDLRAFETKEVRRK